MRTLPPGFRRFDAAHYLESDDMIAEFVAESWQDAIEIDKPELFLRAVDSAMRARKRNHTGEPLEQGNGKRPQATDIFRLMRDLGISLATHATPARKLTRPPRKGRAARTAELAEA